MSSSENLQLGQAAWKAFLNTLFRVAFAITIAIIICQFPFDFFESYLYDMRVRTKPVSAVSGNIELISVDGATLDSLRRSPNAKDHTQLLEKLAAVHPKAIWLLINPTELVGSLEELEKLSETLKAHPEFYVAINDLWPKSQDDDYKLQPPFDKIRPQMAPTTSDHFLQAKDDVTRRMMVSFQGQPLLHTITAALFNPTLSNESKVRGLFNYFESNQIYIDFRPAHSYPTTSFAKLLNGESGFSQFTGKIVLIGRDNQSTPKDYARTPFSREVIAMSHLELHANMLDTLILNSAYERAAPWIDWLLTCLISILTVYVVLTLKPTRGIVILVATLGTFTLLTFMLLWFGRLWIGMAHPYLSIFICYYFFIPYRLIIENRKSWEYLQKNQILVQVEELKTNFLSMMSHDLKTPIARIQGMADVALKDPNPLSPKQKEALTTLQKSSEDLLEFVSSILNLGRIESKELTLHLQSKDPNLLLEDVISKNAYLAKQKHIEIVTELDPLFSIKMDVDLIRQVFSNLIENAIKYSGEGTRVLITSEEANGEVVIQIADQGAGIPADEIGHVFMKFYRSKDAKSSKIKGSGLGLYLAKYFVELHKGRLLAESVLGQGSTFTVILPQS